ncbi:MAG: glycosyltransferase family 4 protein [Flavobacteriaceae bacterium]|nr:glycosyltransferase family 4 protein [Flavobacteriaceae bacterium]
MKPGGAERVLSTLANHLIEEYDVSIICLYSCTPFYELNENIKVFYCLDEYRDSSSFLYSLKIHTSLLRKINRLLKDLDTDLIIGFMTIKCIYAVICGKLRGIPSIISERIHPSYSPISSFWFKMRRWIYPRATALVVQTNEIKRYFDEFVDSDKIHIIVNPLSLSLVGKKVATDRENIILNIGRLDNQKNQELLIRAFASSDFKDWKLYLIGEGVNFEKYSKLIADLGLNDHVILLGRSDQIEEYYNRAKIFALSSNFEGFPNVLIEAMYFGLAVVSTDCPSGPSDIITHNENGILVPVDDKAAMARSLNLLMTNNDICERLGDRAELSVSDYNTDVIVSKWKSLILSCL